MLTVGWMPLEKDLELMPPASGLQLTKLSISVDMEHEDDVDQEQRLINEGKAVSSHCPLLCLCVTFAQLTNLEEYKTWKKNSPFLYDMILRYFTLPLPLSLSLPSR